MTERSLPVDEAMNPTGLPVVVVNEGGVHH